MNSVNVKNKICKIIDEGWQCYQRKVSNGLLSPENEKMMQLQLAQVYQNIFPNYEYERSESIKVLLEVPITIGNMFRSIDIVITHTLSGRTTYYAIEIKCFRLMTRTGSGKRGAQNLGMYDYWEDIENIEKYVKTGHYIKGFQFTLTDDSYYVIAKHKGSQVAAYSTNKERKGVRGALIHKIANRKGEINLQGMYDLDGWVKDGKFWFIQTNVR